MKLNKQSGFEVPVYGSITTRNIVHGYYRTCDCKYIETGNDTAKWSYNSKIVKTLHEWNPVKSISCTKPSESDDKILYKGYIADHAAHFKYGILEINCFRGNQRTPRKSPPTSSYYFKEGDTYFFIFQLMNNDKSYKIGIAGAATDIDDYELQYMDNCTERNDDLCLDVLILTVPGSKF